MTATPRGAPGPEDRVRHIQSLMARLEWVSGRTARELAAQWGLAVGTVENDAADASRRMRRVGDPVPGAIEFLIDNLRAGILGAVAEGDWKALPGLLEVARKVLGVPTPDAAASINVLVERRATEVAGEGDAMIADALLSEFAAECAVAGIGGDLVARVRSGLGRRLAGPVLVETVGAAVGDGEGER